jgi:hypothetical protein
MPSNQLEAIFNCGCCGGDTCCTGRCFPYINELFSGTCTGAPGENPLPSNLTVEITSDSPYGCWTLSAVVEMTEYGRWGNGQVSGTCTFCCYYDAGLNCTWTFVANVIVQCGSSGGWLLEWQHAGSGGPLDVLPPENAQLTKASCDPILLTGEVCYFPGMACIASIMPPTPPITHPLLCFSITVSETL